MSLLNKIKSYPHFVNERVFRLENSNGEGPFSGGGVRFIPESYFNNNLPAEKAGFPMEVYNLLIRGIAKSGCKSHEALVSIFTEPVIAVLRENGFEIVSYIAVMGWEAENQILFIDEDNLDKI